MCGVCDSPGRTRAGAKRSARPNANVRARFPRVPSCASCELREQTPHSRMVPMPYQLYVISLQKQVLENKRYHRANPQYIPGKPCIYVGATSRTPAERLAQHLSGYKANPYAKRFGKSLFEWAFKDTGSFERWPEAEAAERALADKYRAMGWGVWQN